MLLLVAARRCWGLEAGKAWVPNALTVGRLAAVPVATGAIAVDSMGVARTAFALASATDFLDGYLARRWRVESKFGKFLDPVADKLMVASVLVALTGRSGPSVGLPAAVVVCREIAVSALREWAAQSGRSELVQVGAAGKLKTTAQFLALLALLFELPFGLPLLYLAAGLTLQSGALLFAQGAPLFVGERRRK